MERYQEIDVLKGIAVICMIIFHLFYFPNQYGFKEIKYDTKELKILAKVAQFIFITCVGINLVLANNNEKSNSEKFNSNIKRTLKIAVLAGLMSLFTYFVFGKKYVKFGILHFIAFSSLALFMFVNDKKIILIIASVLSGLYILNKYNPELFYNVSEPIAFIMGFYNKSYESFDHFPIVPWMILVCVGIFIGHYIIKEKPKINLLTDTPLSEFLKKTGKYSLEIYAVHWLVLYYIFAFIYPKYFRNSLLNNKI